ncbi:MAG: copper resistance protein B, partial [Gammaproteobacteria bacterium]|nr:copper resistance protein B [Gammaproteobacteria bacterium]
MKKLTSVMMAFSIAGSAFAGGVDDPLLYKVMIDQLEVREADGKNPTVWEVDAWLGKDLNKLWFKSEGEYVDSKTEEAETQ